MRISDWSSDVCSSGSGHGCLFSVHVPMAATPRPEIAAPAASDQPLDVSGLRVLVIDDEPIILEGIQVLMESWGCQVRTAEDGRQAMQDRQSTRLNSSH